MSDNTNAQPTSVRKLRHSIRKRVYVVLQMTGGVPGATKDQQIAVFDQQIKLLEEALEKAKQARDIVFLRDFDSHQETKKAQQEQQTAHDAVTLPESEKSQFEQMVESLSAEFDAKYGGFKSDEEKAAEQAAKDQPDF